MEHTREISPDMIIQYSIVGLILLAAFGWILWKMLRKNKGGSSDSCCGCAIADSCQKKNLVKTEKIEKRGKPDKCN